jgi:hypothetical protein
LASCQPGIEGDCGIVEIWILMICHQTD